MKSYLGIFKMSFKGELQYRAKAISGMATQIFWAFMYIYLYTAFMGGKMIDGFSLQQMTSYVWLGQAFLVFRFLDLPKNCAHEIENGNVCYKFVRPINLYNQWFAEYFGNKLSATILRSAPLIAIAFLMPKTHRLMLPVSFEAFVLFWIAVLLGFLMTTAISMIIVYLTFKTLSARGTVTICNTVCGLLGGLYIPLVFMPEGVQKILNYLPFRYSLDIPARIYIGNLAPAEAIPFILLGFVWLVVLVLIGKLLLKRAGNNAVIQGG